MNKQKTVKRLQKVEELLNISADTLDELEVEDIEDLDPAITNIEIEPESVEGEIVPVDDHIPTGNDSLIELQELKKTFVMVKQNINKLVMHGQTLMSQTLGTQISEIKASDLDAISNLSNTVGSQLKMLVDIHHDIVKIELDLKKLRGELLPEGASVTNNNLIAANPTDILNQIANIKKAQ